MRRSDWAVVAIIGSSIAYELLAPRDDLISHAMDRYIARHPWLVRLAIGTIALHLANLLPHRLDPFHGFRRPSPRG